MSGGLGAFDAQRAPRVWGFRLGDRADHWLAFRLNRRHYRSSTGRAVGARGNPVTRVVLLLLALPVLLLGPACLVYGCYLLVDGPGMSPMVGLVLAPTGAGIVWPWRRKRHRWEQWPVHEADAPALFALVDRIATAAGTPRPDEIVLDHHVNAHTVVRGWRRRRQLGVGLPLWGALAPAERIALLAHELGHFVNHDSRRGLVVGGSLRTLSKLLEMLGASPRRNNWILLVWLLAFAVPLRLVFTAMLILGGRDSQRAEYLADQIAARVGGSTAAAGLFDALIFAPRLYPAMAAGHQELADPKSWRAAALYAQSRVIDLELARQLSLREQASLLASHPPDGLRGRMVRSRPACEPQVTLTDEEWAAVDAELAPWFVKLRSRLRS